MQKDEGSKEKQRTLSPVLVKQVDPPALHCERHKHDVAGIASVSLSALPGGRSSTVPVFEDPVTSESQDQMFIDSGDAGRKLQQPHRHRRRRRDQSSHAWLHSWT